MQVVITQSQVALAYIDVRLMRPPSESTVLLECRHPRKE
jgi:hypothetical protein